jgi:hypothetical protein
MNYDQEAAQRAIAHAVLFCAATAIDRAAVGETLG